MILTRRHSPMLKRANERKAQAADIAAEARAAKSDGRNAGKREAEQEYERRYVQFVKPPDYRESLERRHVTLLQDPPKYRTLRVPLMPDRRIAFRFPERASIEMRVVDFEPKIQRFMVDDYNEVVWWTWDQVYR